MQQSQSIDGVTSIPSKFIWKPLIEDVRITPSDMATDITPRQIPGYSQITSTIGMDIVLTKPMGIHSYQYYRTLREYPVIKLTRNIIFGAILNAEWMIEDNDKAPAGASDLLESFIDKRMEIMAPIIQSLVDYGFIAAESLWKKDNNNLLFDGIKQQIVDMVWIITHGWSGKYLGIRELYLAIPAIKALLISNGSGTGIPEGSQYYGMPWIHGAAWHYEQMLQCAASANRYDKLVAGAFRHIQYPKGTNSCGEDNGMLAKRYAEVIKAGGTIYTEKDFSPEAMSGQSDEAIKARKWEVDIVGDDAQRQHSFGERLDYLDRQMIMGCGLPVLSVMEPGHAKLGASNETSQHTDAAMAYIEYYFKVLTHQINKQLVDVALEFNYGPEARGTIKLLPAGIHDDTKQLFKDILTKGLDNPDEFAKIDHQEIRDRFHIPENENPEPVPQVEPITNNLQQENKEEQLIEKNEGK